MAPFNAGALVDRLTHGAVAVRALVGHLRIDELRFVPPHGAWSIVEILGHLADEEVEDFRARLRSTLESPATPWPPIDPEAAVKARGYLRGDPAAPLGRFVRERAESVAWLRSLGEPDWSIAHVHPRIGPISAGSLLASWAAHDALHVRQIAKRLHELAARDAGPFTIDYAGEWRA